MFLTNVSTVCFKTLYTFWNIKAERSLSVSNTKCGVDKGVDGPIRVLKSKIIFKTLFDLKACRIFIMMTRPLTNIRVFIY